MGIEFIVGLLILLYEAQKPKAPKLPHIRIFPTPPQLPPSPDQPLPQINVNPLPPAPAPTAPVQHGPVPWPQAIPSDLPPWPSGWSPANPVTGAMVTRAFQLLPQLWGFGQGTWKPEKTGDRWVVYEAAMTQKPDGSAAKGVVAFTAPSSAPGGQVSVTPGGALTTPASAHTGLPPTLRQGSSGANVIMLQNMLGISADGKFGPGTKAAVVSYQSAHGLTPDGVVGPMTWTSLGGGASQAA